jgi:hypothetical protein
VKPASAKAKGTAGEREIAAIFGGHRMLLSGAAGGGDVTDCDPPYDGLMWEVKRRAKLPAIVTAPLAQAAFAARGLNYFPAVAYREDRGRWAVAMYAEDFRAFVDAAYEVGQGAKLRALSRQLHTIADEMKGLT